MSIAKWFTTEIYIQNMTTAFGGAATYTSVSGYNMGYIRVLSQRERASIDKPTLFSTHRVAMTKDITPVYGQFLLIGSTRYKVKGVNPQALSSFSSMATDLQTVDCEIVL